MSYDISYTGIRLKPFTREDTDLNGYEKTNVMKSKERHMHCCSTQCQYVCNHPKGALGYFDKVHQLVVRYESNTQPAL